MILMIDNYDSFTYNLVQYMGELGADMQVHRNDCISIADIERLLAETCVRAGSRVAAWPADTSSAVAPTSVARNLT